MTGAGAQSSVHSVRVMCVSDASCNENRTAGNHAVSNQNAGIGDSAYSRTQSIGDGVTNYPSYRVPIENRTGGTDAPTGAQRPNPAQPAGLYRAVNFPRGSAVAPSRRRGARAGATAHASARRQPRRAPRRGPLRGYDSSGPKSVTPRSNI